MSTELDPTKMLITLTAQELQELVRDTVDRAVRVAIHEAQPSTEHSPAQPRWVDVKGAAQHFGVTPTTIRAWIRNGAPVRKFGPTTQPVIRIDLAEFAAWVERPAPAKAV